ncbi:MAG: succinyl-diaminopimelate desuccinylase [Mariprofundaceae bacterium]|nr:succinyl-diaminopimelate desuccinylase [Mariprofundaceae bacterium]
MDHQSKRPCIFRRTSTILNTDALTHAIELIQKKSITPKDQGCQDYIEQVLDPLGFSRESIDCGGVWNSIYCRKGELTGLLAFAGHTDVVPTGPANMWLHPPFSAVVAIDNAGKEILHGRGAQDMKGGIACFLAAVLRLHQQNINMPSLQLLITSDEEGESIDGTIRIVEALQEKKALPDAVIVGEPSCRHYVGDTIRRGRRGVVQARIVFQGKQGHSAYPDDANNAIHLALPALHAIAAIHWGQACDGFPATSCQISNLNAGTGAINVIPGEAVASLDIRYNPNNTFEDIQARVDACCMNITCHIEWNHTAIAFSTPDGAFLDLVDRSIFHCTGIKTIRDTGGGTSDGRFFAAAGVPVVELGLTNSTIHQMNECVALDELTTLTDIYAHIIASFGDIMPHHSNQT